MAFLSFEGTRVGASGGANDDGNGGTHLILDQGVDLDGNGNPFYAATDTILIEIDDADITANGEFTPGGSDGEVTVLSIQVNGVELLSSPDKIKFGGGSDTFEGDAYFFVEGIKLFFLAPAYPETFADAVDDDGELVLTIENRVLDHDFNDNDELDAGTEEVGNGVFNVQTSNVVCFAAGTLIATPNGPRAIEELRAGDIVETLDHGPQPIRWTRSSDHALDGLGTEDKPVLISAGALGGGHPAQDLIVSPQHRVFVGGHDQLQHAFDEECFVPAKALTVLPGIRHMRGKRQVTWIHFVCDRHEIVVANGCYAEALLLGPMVLKGLSRSERRDVSGIFGAPPSPNAPLNGPPARHCLKVTEARHHLRHRRTPLQSGYAQSVALGHAEGLRGCRAI